MFAYLKVAQVSNLLYRRFPIGSARAQEDAVETSSDQLVTFCETPHSWFILAHSSITFSQSFPRIPNLSHDFPQFPGFSRYFPLAE